MTSITVPDEAKTKFSAKLVDMRKYCEMAAQRFNVLNTALKGTAQADKARQLFSDMLRGMELAKGVLERIEPSMQQSTLNSEELGQAVQDLNIEANFSSLEPLRQFHMRELPTLLKQAPTEQLAKAGLIYNDPKQPLNCCINDPITNANEDVIAVDPSGGTSDPNYTMDPAGLGLMAVEIVSRQLSRLRGSQKPGFNANTSVTNISLP